MGMMITGNDLRIPQDGNNIPSGDIVIGVSLGDYGKPRPAAVVQSDLFNSTHASITVCPITTHLLETPLFRVLLSPTKENGLKEISQIMIDKITTLRKEKISKKIGKLDEEQQYTLNHALCLFLNLIKE